MILKSIFHIQYIFSVFLRIFCLGDNCQCDNIAISRDGGPFEGGSTCFNPGGDEFCYISKAKNFRAT